MSFRLATMDDAARLFAWRNDPEARAASKDTDAITFADHLRWLIATLKSDKTILIIARDTSRGVYVGMYRIDIDGKKRGVISLVVGAEHRGHGYAAMLLEDALTHTASLKSFVAEIRESNTASLRAFWALGFRPTKQTGEGIVTLEKEVAHAS